MTGWGQDGDRALSAGHDINYLAVTGVLEAMGPAGSPPAPRLSLVGDFGGGSMLLVVGALAALHDRTRSGRGQVIDAAMVDGAGLLAALQWSWKAAGRWGSRDRGNLLDGSAPFYATYRCADGNFIAVGALEEKFWRNLVDTLGVGDLPDRWDRASWPVIGAALQARFGTRTRDDWGSVFADIDACVTPVLDFDEAAADPVAVQRARSCASTTRSHRRPHRGSPGPCCPLPPRRRRYRWGEIVDERSVATVTAR